MKPIQTNGIPFIQPLQECPEWYWGSDYTSGDLYEAEELFQQGHPIRKNRLIFIHYPDGTLVEPMIAEEGQYFGCPAWDQGRLILLLADFPRAEIHLFAYDPDAHSTTLLTSLPRSAVEDCYNLMPVSSPLMLIRHSNDQLFQVLWPEPLEFQLQPRECFDHRDGDRLYFTIWFEDPDYREEVLVRDTRTGEILQRLDGSLTTLPDGQKWLLI